MGHIVGQSRDQLALFPTTLDEAVSEDHPVRVIDSFVDSLDLRGLGFSKVAAEATGRPPYAPGDLLKLYIWGYANRVRSSRGLEREAERNVEVMWLVHGLTPAFKTIADFRKDRPEAIVTVSGGSSSSAGSCPCSGARSSRSTAPRSKRWRAARRC
jgi:transposase